MQLSFLPYTHGNLRLIPKSKNLCFSKDYSIYWKVHSRKKILQFCRHANRCWWKSKRYSSGCKLVHCTAGKAVLAVPANGSQLIVDNTKLSQLREGTDSPTMTVWHQFLVSKNIFSCKIFALTHKILLRPFPPNLPHNTHPGSIWERHRGHSCQAILHSSEPIAFEFKRFKQTWEVFVYDWNNTNKLV